MFYFDSSYVQIPQKKMSFQLCIRPYFFRGTWRHSQAEASVILEMTQTWRKQGSAPKREREGQIDRERERDRNREREKEIGTERERKRQEQRERERDRNRERKREKERLNERERKVGKEREKERQRKKILIFVPVIHSLGSCL